MRALITGLVVLLGAALVPLTVAAPASAEQKVRHDRIGDSNDGDIRKVVVRHKRRKAVINVVFVDRANPEEMWLRVDRPKTKKWDWSMGTGGYYPRWYSIWDRGDLSDDPACSLKRRWTTRHKIRMVVPRRCFDGAKKLRVRVAWSDDDVQFGDEDRTRWTRYAQRG
ncbi:MAG: hypothetical protein L0K86_10185 [Actinomycetia bacterium]|nr:hypothetical protein [Actinomycetes bacterium]